MFGLTFILALAMLIINVFVLVYIDKLEKIGCECAKDWRKTYAYVYLITSIVYGFLAGVTYTASQTNASSNVLKILSVVMFVGQIILFVAGILYIIFSIQYINKLRDIKCKCSKHLTRDVWEVVLYIQVVLIILAVILAVVSFFTVKDSIPMMSLPYKAKEMKSTLSSSTSKNLSTNKK